MLRLDFLVAEFEDRYGFGQEKAEEYARAARQEIEKRGFQVHDLPPPRNPGSSSDFRTGYFKGKDIYLDPALQPHIKLAALTHLVGHAIQWACAENPLFISGEEARDIGNRFWHGASDEELEKVTEYEEQASRIGLDILHDIGITDTDQFISDYFRADNAFLLHFYRTKEVLPLADFWPPPPLEPLDVNPALFQDNKSGNIQESAPVLANFGTPPVSKPADFSI